MDTQLRWIDAVDDEIERVRHERAAPFCDTEVAASTCGFPQSRHESSPAALPSIVHLVLWGRIRRPDSSPGRGPTPPSLRISAPTANCAPAFSPGEGVVLLPALAHSEVMTCAPPIADVADSDVDRVQLHLALASVSYIGGQVADVLVDEAFADDAVRRLEAGGIQTP